MTSAVRFAVLTDVHANLPALDEVNGTGLNSRSFERFLDLPILPGVISTNGRNLPPQRFPHPDVWTGIHTFPYDAAPLAGGP